MLNYLPSLITFAHSSTMADAALQLRISQSALSKRLAALEHELGYPILEKRGRRVSLNAQGLQLLNRLEPLLGEISDVLDQHALPQKRQLEIGLADAIMASWGANMIARSMVDNPHITINLHSHRTATLLERVNSGQYQIGICSGSVQKSTSLIVEPLFDETMALILSNNHLSQYQQWLEGRHHLDVVCIEKKSAMWHCLKPHMERWKLRASTRLESSVGGAQLALAGTGHALVPIGVAISQAPQNQWVALTAHPSLEIEKSLSRPCSLVVRKSLYHAPNIKPFLDSLHSFKLPC